VTGPNESALESSKCLIPDWTKSSGGYGAGLSPDGKILLYLTDAYSPSHDVEQQVWIHNVFEAYGIKPDGWKLDVKIAVRPGEDSREAPILRSLGSGTTEWSPDGKRVVFVFHGRLYIAENINVQLQTASVRMLADVKTISMLEAKQSYFDGTANTRCELPVIFPRWSPDGTKIAFWRYLDYDWFYCDLCVIDVESGKETVLANDCEAAISSPWSPDGTELVYSTVDLKKKKYATKFISLDGKITATIQCLGNAEWSPDGQWLIENGTTIAVDKKGKNLRYLTYAESPYKKGEYNAAFFQRLWKFVKDRYSKYFTDNQLSRLNSYEMTQNEMWLFAQYGTLKERADSKNADLQQKIEDIGAMFAVPVDTSSISEAISKAVEMLPDRSSYDAFITYMNTTVDSESSIRDCNGTWSPDGKTVAFIRVDNKNPNDKKVLLVDLKSHKETLVFSADEVVSVTWACGGKALLVVAARTLASQTDSHHAGGLTIQSYPEIWLLKLKTNTLPVTTVISKSDTQPKTTAKSIPVKSKPKTKAPEYKQYEKGVPVKVYICPGSVGLQTDGKIKFQVFGIDAWGNETQLSGKVNWSVDSSAGKIGSDGTFTATSKYGNYPNAVKVAVGDTFKAVASVEILKREDHNGYVLDRTIGGSPEQFINTPYDVAVSKSGHIYIADRNGNKIKEYSKDGTLINQFGSSGRGDGELNGPNAITLDAQENIYVVDWHNSRVQKFDTSGKYLAKFGKYGELANPTTIAVDISQNVYVSDNISVKKFDPTGKLIKSFGGRGGGDGQFSNGPNGMTVDRNGFVYVSDGERRIIDKFDSSGALVKHWSSKVPEDVYDSYPTRMALSPDGNSILVVDTRQTIKKYDLDGNFLGLVQISSDMRNEPEYINCLAVDSNGNMWSTDLENHIVWRCDPEGKCTRFLDSKGVKNGNLRQPIAIRVDKTGSVNVADFGNYPAVQRFDSDLNFTGSLRPSGQMPEVLGAGRDSEIFPRTYLDCVMNGTSDEWHIICNSMGNAPDQLGALSTTAMDKDGNIYITDPLKYRVHKWTASGSYVMKWGTEGNGDGQFECPTGIAVDMNGCVYVADHLNTCIQKFDSKGKFLKRWTLEGCSIGYSLVSDKQNRIYVANEENNDISIFDSEGNLLSSIVLKGVFPIDITLDSEGNIYVVDKRNNKILKYVAGASPTNDLTPKSSN